MPRLKQNHEDKFVREGVLALKEKIREYIETNKDELINTLKEVVQIETVVGNEMPGQAYMKKKYEEIGLEIHEVEPVYEKLKDHEAFVDSGIPFEGRKNLVGIYKGKKAGKSLTLHGHIDVVSPEPVENWTQDPWGAEIIDGHMYGRGSADMKAGLVANWFALKTLVDLGYPVAGDVQLHSTIEEEAGGGGGALALLEEGYRTEGFVTTEPHALNTTVSHAGVMYFKVIVKGKTAHAGLAHQGVNAISKMMPVYQALEDLSNWRGKNIRFELYEKGSGQACHLNLGRLTAGDWVSTVPGEAVLECRIGFIPGETRKDIKKLLDDTIAKATADDEWYASHPPVIEYFGWTTEPWYQDPKHPLITTFQESTKHVLCKESEIIGRASGNDARFTQYYEGMAGFATGPVGYHIHGPDEHVELESVIQLTEILANFIIDWTENEA